MCDFNFSDDDFFAIFPTLYDNCAITSRATCQYNSVAHALNDTSKWWSPDAMEIYYWPLRDRNDTLEAYQRVFELHNYEICNSLSFEQGYEKIVIYYDGEKVSHVARQNENGTWTSKILHYQDIEHNTPVVLEGQRFGYVCLMMRRQLG